MTPEEKEYYDNIKNDKSLNEYAFDQLFETINGNEILLKNKHFKLIGGIPFISEAVESSFLSGLQIQNLESSNMEEISNLYHSPINSFDKKIIVLPLDINKRGNFSDSYYIQNDLLDLGYGSAGLSDLSSEDLNRIGNGEAITYYCKKIEMNDNDSVLDFYNNNELSSEYMNAQYCYILLIYKKNTQESSEDILCAKLNWMAYDVLNKNSESAILDISDKITELYLNDKNYNYSVKKIKETIESELEFNRIENEQGNLNSQGTSSQKKKKEIYNKNLIFFKNKCANPSDKATLQALKQLCDVISKIKKETSEVNNFTFKNKSDWNNYDFIGPDFKNQKFEASDLIAFKNSLLLLNKEIGKFEKGNFSSGSEIVEFANKHLLSGGGKFKWFNQNPFVNLEKDIRLNLLKKLILLALNNQRISLRDELNPLDIIDAIFETCFEIDDFYYLITELEKENMLFELLLKTAKLGTFFGVLSARIGQVMQMKNSENKELLDECVENGNYFFFDSTFFGSSNDEKYDQDKKKISFRTQVTIYTKIGEKLTKINRNGDMGMVPVLEAKPFDSGLRYYKPLDWVLITPIEDIDMNGFVYQKGQNYCLPACTAYLLFQKDTIENLLKAVNFTLNMLMIVSGVAELTYAVKSASALGIALGTTDLAVTTANIIAQEEGFEHDNPQLSKIIHYTTWFYVMVRLNVRYDGKGIIDIGKGVQQEISQTLKQISYFTRKALQDLKINIKLSGKYFILIWKNKPIFKGTGKEIDTFFKKIKPLLKTGTGGSLKYLEILSRNMVAQEHSMSCAAACIRQLAKDNGIEITEEAVRILAGTSKELGTYEKGMTDAASKIFKGKNFGEGTVDHIPISTVELSSLLNSKKSWIAWVKTSGNSGNHAIIIDKIENELVYIRDPWPINGIREGEKGIEATLKLADFEIIWGATGKYAFWFKN